MRGLRGELLSLLQPHFSSASTARSDQPIAGLPPGLLTAAASNMGIMQQLYSELPLLGMVANERAFSTDDCELYFSSTAITTNYRGDAPTVLGQVGRVDLLTSLRRNPNLSRSRDCHA